MTKPDVIVRVYIVDKPMTPILISVKLFYINGEGLFIGKLKIFEIFWSYKGYSLVAFVLLSIKLALKVALYNFCKYVVKNAGPKSNSWFPTAEASVIIWL